MDIELICQWFFRKRKNSSKSIRIPNDIQILEKGSYIIKIYKIDLEVN